MAILRARRRLQSSKRAQQTEAPTERGVERRRCEATRFSAIVFKNVFTPLQIFCVSTAEMPAATEWPGLWSRVKLVGSVAPATSRLRRHGATSLAVLAGSARMQISHSRGERVKIIARQTMAARLMYLEPRR